MAISNEAGYLTIAITVVLVIVYNSYKSRALNREQKVLKKQTISELRKQELDKRKQSYLKIQEDIAKLEDIDTLLTQALTKGMNTGLVFELHTKSVNKATEYVKKEYAQKKRGKPNRESNRFRDDDPFNMFDNDTPQCPDYDNPGMDINGGVMR
jgi:hypothetical protein